MKFPAYVHADMCRHNFKFAGGMRYMFNFEHQGSLKTELLEQIVKLLNKNGTKFQVDYTGFIKRGTCTRIFTFDLNDMNMAIEILNKELPNFTLTYRGRIVK